MDDVTESVSSKRKTRPAQKLYVPPAQRNRKQTTKMCEVNKMKSTNGSNDEEKTTTKLELLELNNHDELNITASTKTDLTIENNRMQPEIESDEPLPTKIGTEMKKVQRESDELITHKNNRTGPDKNGDTEVDKVKEEPRAIFNTKKKSRPLLRNKNDILQIETKQTSNKSNKKSPVKLVQVANWEDLFLDDHDDQEDNYNNQFVLQRPLVEMSDEAEETEIVNPKMQELEHVIEVFDFPSTFRTQDIMLLYNEIAKEMYIKWCDETHALLVLGSLSQAQRALSLQHDIIKSRPMTMAGPTAMQIALKCDLKPAMKRPPTTMQAARRMITTALGAKTHISREVQEKERETLRLAKELKRAQRQNERDAWEGNPRPSTA